MAGTITKLGVAGFKSAMTRVDVNIKDITVLAGQNSAGKSTIIQPALMIKQTLEKPFDAGGLAIDGPLVKFTSTDQFLSGPRRPKNGGSLEMFIATDDEEFLLYFGKSENGGLNPNEMRFKSGGEYYKWTYGQNLSLDDPSLDPLIRLFVSVVGSAATVKIVRSRCWLGAQVSESKSPNVNVEIAALSPISAQMQQIQSMIHIPGLRGNPERDYRISGVGPDFPGNFADYVASIVHMWAEKKDPNADRLGINLKKLGLTWKVIAKRLDDTRVEIRVGRLSAGSRGGAHDTVSIADVGFGVSQTLPVLVALLAAREGQLVFIEQPEIHLHPRAQTALADMIVEAAERGVRVIIETHSGLLLLALQTLISEGRIDPGRVSLNWFTRNTKGQTEVFEAAIRDDGSYGDWPVDFGSIALELENRFLDSVDAHRALVRQEG
jgi:hypothetical protein